MAVVVAVPVASPACHPAAPPDVPGVSRQPPSEVPMSKNARPHLAERAKGEEKAKLALNRSPSGTVDLFFEPQHALEQVDDPIWEDVSALAVAGRSIFCTCDETSTIERLTFDPETGKAGEHRNFVARHDLRLARGPVRRDGHRGARHRRRLSLGLRLAVADARRPGGRRAEGHGGHRLGRQSGLPRPGAAARPRRRRLRSRRRDRQARRPAGEDGGDAADVAQAQERLSSGRCCRTTR